MAFKACSGQGRGARQWAVWDDEGPLWWRLSDANDRTRLFASQKAAQRAADRLDVVQVYLPLARERRQLLAEYRRRGGVPYRGLVAEADRFDPFRLFAEEFA